MHVLIDGLIFATGHRDRAPCRALRRLLHEMLPHDPIHQWSIALAGERDFQLFDEDVRRVLRPLFVGEGASGIPNGESYFQWLRNTIEAERIDVYWHPHALAPDVPSPRDLPVRASCLTLDDGSLAVALASGWSPAPAAHREEMRRRLRAAAEDRTQIAFATRASRDLCENAYPQLNRTSQVVPPNTPFDFSGHHRMAPCVMLVMDVEATGGSPATFVQLTNWFRQSSYGWQLAVAGFIPPDLNAWLAQSRDAQVGARPGPWERVLRRWVAQSQPSATGLILLVTDVAEQAHVIRTAQALGAPVVVPKSTPACDTSGPTIFGYDPNTDDDLFRALREAEATCQSNVPPATDDQTELRRSAEAHIDWLYDAFCARRPRRERKLRLAYASPWPPHATGIARYSASIVPHLRKHVDVTLFTENLAEPEDPAGLPMYALEELPRRAGDFDVTLYHVGNNTDFHRSIYKLACRRPGVVVLHDYNIHGFLAGAFLYGGEPDVFYDAVEASCGMRRADCRPEQLDLFDYPLCQALAQRSLGTIVHSRWVQAQLQGIDGIYMVPHGAVIHPPSSSPALLDQLRDRIALREHEFLISSLGFANRLKRIDVILQAVAHLHQKGYPVRFVIGGAITDDQQHLLDMIPQLGLQRAVTVTGYLSDEEFDGLLELSDVVMNLRCPSMGESSGVLFKTLALGKPCIVSDYQQFAEFPDDVCWRIDVGGAELGQLVLALEALLSSPRLRNQLGQSAKHFVNHTCSYAGTAKLYADVLTDVVARQRRMPLPRNSQAA